MYFLSSLLEYLNGRCSFNSSVLTSNCSPHFLYPTPLYFHCSLLVSWDVLMSSVQGHSFHSLISSYVTLFICALCLVLFLLGHFLSIPDWTSPIFFSLFQTLTVLLLWQHEESNLLSIPLFNSIGQLYLLLCSLVLLCLFLAFVIYHLHSNCKLWIQKQSAISFISANVFWMSPNLWSEWHAGQFNMVKPSLSIGAWVLTSSFSVALGDSRVPHSVSWHRHMSSVHFKVWGGFSLEGEKWGALRASLPYLYFLLF